MGDEENIAIETLKEVASDDFDTLGDDISPKMAQNILNVIDKQQKEIEELTRLKNIYKKTRPIGEVFHDLLKEKEYINKDKIREKLKEIENRRIEEGKCELAIYGFQRDAKIEVLQELLEENK